MLGHLKNVCFYFNSFLRVNTDRYTPRSATLYSDRTQVQILTLALFAYVIFDISCDLLEPIEIIIFS